MNIATHYARALYDLIEDNPRKGATYVSNLGEVLKRRGHQRLLPRIFSEYERLQLAKTRSQRQQEVTPEQERTRILLELYRKLTQTA